MLNKKERGGKGMRKATRKAGKDRRLFILGVLIGGVFSALLVPAIAPSVLDARNRSTPMPPPAGVEVAALSGEASSAGPAPQDAADTTREARVEVRRGSNLMATLLQAGVKRAEAHEAIVALEQVFDPRDLIAGQPIDLLLSADDADKLLSVSIPVGPERTFAAYRDADDLFVSETIDNPLELKAVRAAGTIEDSLFNATSAAGVPDRVIMEFIRILGWDVDFQRDIQRGDTFELMFETFLDDDGETVKSGEVLVASLVLSGTEIRLFRHELADGTIDYFNEKGESVRKALLRTPVDGARLSSSYGRRKHPVLGYTRMHRGVDFAAPRGTPIMAAGDGVIEFAGTNGGYGRYVRIRHGSTYKTAYAHMRGFEDGIRAGVRVKQGQIIGFIGTTGLSTGPHLHYEVLRDGAQINPLSLKLPTGRTLEGEELRRFAETRDDLERQIAALGGAMQTAAKEAETD